MQIDIENGGPLDLDRLDQADLKRLSRQRRGLVGELPRMPDLSPFLGNLQGNILKDHGRDFAFHLFVKFTGLQDAIKAWITGLSGEVTSALQQQADAWDRKQARRERLIGEYDPILVPGIDDIMFMNFFLSAAGYQYLGEPLPENNRKDDPFAQGMKKTGKRLNDPPPAEWEEQFRGEIHAMILIANDVEGKLEEKEYELKHSLKGIGEVIVTERGKMMYKNGDKSKPIEHFGYVDGISQPLLVKKDIRKTGGDDKWNPFESLNIALVEEKRRAKDAPEGYGSYLVFRKLEQNVRRFYERIDVMAQVLSTSKKVVGRTTPAEAGALVMGRYRDGTPVNTPPDKASPEDVDKFNNFNFDGDPDGEGCPLHAHVRMTNARGKGKNEHPIVRRSITYGTRAFDLSDRPRNGVGLLFMCFQRDIATQFEFLQRLANGDESKNRTGCDPIIGQPTEQRPQIWPGKVPFAIHEMVKLKGGEYFFAPSIGFLRTLQGGVY